MAVTAKPHTSEVPGYENNINNGIETPTRGYQFHNTS